jgi:hypothetical protein
MITSNNFLWLHLPKTGGTSMNRLFREMNLPGVTVDADETAAKHDSVALRESRSTWRAGQRQRFITLRRLESWLISDWHHKRRHMGQDDLPFEPVRCGLFYSLRAGGVWMAADWWLRYFDIGPDVTPLRLEYLSHDVQHLLLPLLPVGTVSIDQLLLSRDNARPVQQAGPRLEAEDLVQIHTVNPLWSSLQQQLYGSINHKGG